MAGKRNMIATPSAGKLTIKTILAILIGMFVGLLGMTVLYGISEDFVDYGDDTAAMINNCNRYYYEKDYGSLRDSLTTWSLYSEEYDKYWEICDAYAQYVQCIEYAEMDGMEDELKLAQAELGLMAQQCRFAENQNRLDQFAQEVLSLE